ALAVVVVVGSQLLGGSGGTTDAADPGTPSASSSERGVTIRSTQGSSDASPAHESAEADEDAAEVDVKQGAADQPAQEAREERRARRELREFRDGIVEGLRDEVTTFAEGLAAEEKIRGPILSAQCEVSGGDGVYDPEAVVTSFLCIAVTQY